VADDDLESQRDLEGVKEFLDLLRSDILGESIYSANEIASLSHTTFEELEILWMELGFSPREPDERFFTSSDAEAFETLRAIEAAGLVTAEVVAAMSRVLGQALARVATAQAQAFAPTMRDRIHYRQQKELEEGPPDDAEPVAGTEDPNQMATEVFVPVFERFIAYIWRRHLVEAVTRQLLPQTGKSVGFADLVDYTRLTAKTDPDVLAEMIARFHHICNQNVSDNGARVVKLIGDAVLYISDNPTSAVGTAISIQAACAEDRDLPEVRAGVASGDVVDVEGDIFGTTVNRASRLAELARPGTTLIDDDTANSVIGGDEFLLRALRPKRLKGLGFVRVWVARSASSPA
jgi:adenylate cyclase